MRTPSTIFLCPRLLCLGLAFCLTACRSEIAMPIDEFDAKEAEAFLLDYRNGWYHTSNGSESIESIARGYMRDPQIVAQINRTVPQAIPSPQTQLYIPPVHNREDLNALIGRIRRDPTIVPRIPPPVDTFSQPSKMKSVLPPLEAILNQESEPVPLVASPRSPPVREKAKQTVESEYVWPVTGELTQLFDARRGAIYQGITLRVEPNQPIVAAKDGIVIFAGALSGYGNAIILDHGDGRSSVYAFASRLLVRTRVSVRAGQQIAVVGKPTRFSQPQLFFQIRDNNHSRTLDPLAYLPPQM